MSRILVILRREIFAALVSPVMWFSIALAWFLCGVTAYFFSLPHSGGETSAFIFANASWWLWIQLLLIPLLSMRLLSEEKRSGTIEALMTAPVNDHEVVAGKFLAANVVHAVASLILVLAVLPFLFHGRSPDWGQVTASYVTALTVGAMFLAVGVFASSLTQAQVLAGFITVLIEGALLLGPMIALSKLDPENPLAQALVRGDIPGHVREGSIGILDVNNVTYHVVMAALFLLFAVRSLEVRKWK